MDNNDELTILIEGCCRQDSRSQEKLYDLFYNYAMAVGIRYTTTFEEAQEVVNDAFIKVFRYIATHYAPTYSFKTWLRRIIINTALDRLKAKKQVFIINDEYQKYHVGIESEIVEQLTREQILNYVQKLPPQYRTVFNLYVADGYTHPEIAALLHISEATSRSNLSRARQLLKNILKEQVY